LVHIVRLCIVGAFLKWNTKVLILTKSELKQNNQFCTPLVLMSLRSHANPVSDYTVCYSMV